VPRSPNKLDGSLLSAKMSVETPMKPRKRQVPASPKQAALHGRRVAIPEYRSDKRSATVDGGHHVKLWWAGSLD
jgi:hypothetical protein